MKLYVVKYIDAKEAVGLFWCKNVAELAELVSEQTSTDDAEYAVVDGPAAIRSFGQLGGRMRQLDQNAPGPKVGVFMPYDLCAPENPYYDRLGKGIVLTNALRGFFGADVPRRRWKLLPPPPAVSKETLPDVIEFDPEKPTTRHRLD